MITYKGSLDEKRRKVFFWPPCCKQVPAHAQFVQSLTALCRLFSPRDIYVCSYFVEIVCHNAKTPGNHLNLRKLAKASISSFSILKYLLIYYTSLSQDNNYCLNICVHSQCA